MKRVYLTSLLLLMMFVSYGQADLGIGIVSIKFDDKTVLHFFSSPSASKPARTVEFFNDKTINSWNIKNLNNHYKWLNPEVIWLDYHSFAFRCKTQRNGWYEVIVNNENGKTLWLKKNKTTEYQSWEAYLRGMFGIARLQEYTQKIRTSPIEGSKEIKYSGGDCFQVKSMQGDWVQIFSPDYCDNNRKIKSGWIKWKHGKKLLIEYFVTS